MFSSIEDKCVIFFILFTYRNNSHPPKQTKNKTKNKHPKTEQDKKKQKTYARKKNSNLIFFILPLGAAHSLTVIVIGRGLNNLSSNPDRSCLHFASS